MSNLNKIKEEGESELKEKFRAVSDTGHEFIGLYGGENGQILPMPFKKILDWHNKQMDKAYELGRNDLWETYSKEGGYLLGKKEIIDEVVGEIEEMKKGVGTREGWGETASWNKGRFEALEQIKQKLLSLKNKEN